MTFRRVFLSCALLALSASSASRALAVTNPPGDPIQNAVSAAVHAYCAKHPGMSCQMYQGDALRCESPAYGAIPVFQTVAMWKFQHGMTTTQAVRFATLADPSGENAEIAAWAGRFIDVAHLKPSDPVNMMARFFATEVVLKTCLANIQ